MRFSNRCLFYIPTQLVALELESCNINSEWLNEMLDKEKRNETGDGNGKDKTKSNNSLLFFFPNLKFLRVSNCKFLGESLQKLIRACPNLAHLNMTTTKWSYQLRLPSTLLSLIWNANEGDVSLDECKELWEVCITIYDTELLEVLQRMTYLRQITIGVPLLRDLDNLLEEIEPLNFSQIRNVHADPHKKDEHHIRTEVEKLWMTTITSHKYNTVTNTIVTNTGGNSDNVDGTPKLELDVVGLDEEESLALFNSGSHVESTDLLRIVCYNLSELLMSKFIGDKVIFTKERLSNPYLRFHLAQLNQQFVKELVGTTHVFLVTFPFF
ncbi:hypothetical protein RFI_12522 [Reticulomyxa filosa]|uniref:Uncharacterized protein n=1 Tax=Reticulomyxa filosa TaxID=46433 RepID=X6NFF1_RETFI|nr:hypothetical protein RFI_12522 [Reticulomyxa filosa]|eukprot:ETO24633.1 hypothetical protein RFI_12522 [Reticulomyxa filosa]